MSFGGNPERQGFLSLHTMSVRATLARSLSQLQTSDSIQFVCPFTRQSTRQEDSTAISVLTTKWEIYNDNTYFIPLGGERSYERYVQILKRV